MGDSPIGIGKSLEILDDSDKVYALEYNWSSMGELVPLSQFRDLISMISLTTIVQCQIRGGGLLGAVNGQLEYQITLAV